MCRCRDRSLTGLLGLYEGMPLSPTPKPRPRKPPAGKPNPAAAKKAINRAVSAVNGAKPKPLPRKNWKKQ